MKPISFTQCFQAFDETIPVRKDIKDAFYRDNDRQCYGQRWKMPRAYFGSKYVSYEPATETVLIRVIRPGMTPGNLVPRKQFISLYYEMSIHALWNGNFDSVVAHTKKTYGSLGWVKTGRVMYGMNEYDSTRMSSDQWRDIFFFPPEEGANFFLKCLVPPGARVERISPQTENGSCGVIAKIDDRVYFEYQIKYSELPDLIRINAALVKLVRSFMIAR